MQLTEQQVLALAPDAGSANNGKKLAQAKQWPLLGQSGRAVWGECQGSGPKPYQVRVDLADFASKCSCPSFKFPCKHAIGLLVLSANQPALLNGEPEPEWVSDWLDKRADNVAKKEARAAAKAEAPVDEEAQRKRAEKRDNRVKDGLAGLQRWLEDLVRSGLARLPAEGPGLWEQQASRLVDAQATGLAARLRALAELPGQGDDWPDRLLAELGRLALAVHAYERMDHLEPALQATLRQYIGFSLREEDVIAQGDLLRDRWQVVGQYIDTDERVRVQRTWLMGEASAQTVLLLQFAAGGQPFAASWLPGSCFEAELAFWPGTGVRRALLKSTAAALPLPQTFPRAQTLAELLDETANLLAANPWHERSASVLRAIVPVYQGGSWLAVDAAGHALPLAGQDHWLWLALSGGHPLDIAVEWDGRVLQPLGLFVDQRYHVLTKAE